MREHHPSMICRCSDLDMEEIRALIDQGFTSVDELKRIARLGMGPCQGRTCIPLVLQEISRATGKPVAELRPATYRPPVKGIPLGAVADASGLSLAAASGPPPAASQDATHPEGAVPSDACAPALVWTEEGGGAP